MPKSFSDDVDAFTGDDERSCVTVAQLVEREPGESSVGSQPLEPTPNPIGPPRLAVNELTTDSGVTVDGLLIKDGQVTPAS